MSTSWLVSYISSPPIVPAATHTITEKMKRTYVKIKAKISKEGSRRVMKESKACKFTPGSAASTGGEELAEAAAICADKKMFFGYEQLLSLEGRKHTSSHFLFRLSQEINYSIWFAKIVRRSKTLSLFPISGRFGSSLFLLIFSSPFRLHLFFFLALFPLLWFLFFCPSFFLFVFVSWFCFVLCALIAQFILLFCTFLVFCLIVFLFDSSSPLLAVWFWICSQDGARKPTKINPNMLLIQKKRDASYALVFFCFLVCVLVLILDAILFLSRSCFCLVLCRKNVMSRCIGCKQILRQEGKFCQQCAYKRVSVMFSGLSGCILLFKEGMTYRQCSRDGVKVGAQEREQARSQEEWLMQDRKIQMSFVLVSIQCWCYFVLFSVFLDLLCLSICFLSLLHSSLCSALSVSGGVRDVW